MSTIPSNLNFPTSRQVPDQAIMDTFNKQVYLGNQFVASSLPQISAGAETATMLLANPATSKKSVFINYVRLATSVYTFVQLYANPTISVAGTPVVVVNHRFANPNTSVCVVTTFPTATAFGSSVATISADQNAPQTDSNLLYILDPGNSFLITTEIGTTAGIGLVASWYEL